MSPFLEFDYDPALWLAIPHFDEFDEWTDPSHWGRELADDLWADRGMRPREGEVDNLADVLALVAQATLNEDNPGSTENFLYLPHPQMTPIRVKIWIDHDPEIGLRDWAAYDPDAVEPPIVEEFVSDRLGTGLRGLRYFSDVPREGEEAEPVEIFAGLRYAFPVDGEGTVVVLTTVFLDLAVMHKAMLDFDNFARCTYLID